MVNYYYLVLLFRGVVRSTGMIRDRDIAVARLGLGPQGVQSSGDGGCTMADRVGSLVDW